MSRLSVVNDSLWKVATGETKNPNAYESGSGYGLILIEPDINSITSNPIFGKLKKKGINYFAPSVRGILREPIEYSLDSDWSSVSTPFDSGLGKLVNDTSTIAGTGALGGVFTSKLYWRQSGYLTMAPKFRIYDYFGDGHAVRAAKEISKYVVANGEINPLEEIANNITSFAKDSYNESTKKKTADDKKDPLETIRTYLYAAGENFLSDITSLVTLKDAPPTLTVSIGKLFKRNDMVVTKIDIEYAKEYTETGGPIYIDVTLNLSSRTIIRGATDSGIVSESLGKVTVDESAGTVDKPKRRQTPEELAASYR